MTVRITDTEAVDSVEATMTSVVSVEVLVAEVGDQAAFGGDSDFPNRGCPYVPMYRYTAYISYRCSCATLFLALLSVCWRCSCEVSWHRERELGRERFCLHRVGPQLTLRRLVLFRPPGASA